MSRGKLVAVLLAIVAVLMITRRGEVAEEAPAQAAAPEAAPEEAASPQEELRARELEQAVIAALGSVECGYSDVGYAYVAPDEAASHLVRRMRSASGSGWAAGSAGSGIDYVEGRPRGPWQVAVRLSPDKKALLIEGYGADLAEPLVTRRRPCS